MNGLHLRAVAVLAALTLVGGITAVSATAKKGPPAAAAKKARGAQSVGPREQLRLRPERLRRETEERTRRLGEELNRRIREEQLRQQELARQRREEAARKLQEELARRREQAAAKQEEAERRREEAAEKQRQRIRRKRRRRSKQGPTTGTPPKLGKSVGVAADGAVTVQLPGSDEPVSLDEAGTIPVGSVVDARRGEVTITPASSGRNDHATFSGAMFQVLQRPRGGLTDIKLTGGDFDSCGQRAAFGRLAAPLARSAARRKPVRKLWARGKGRFRTRGRHGSATVRGTVWMTADTCAGTLVKVKRGVVDVRDFVRRRTVAVRAGKKYLARARD